MQSVGLSYLLSLFQSMLFLCKAAINKVVKVLRLYVEFSLCRAIGFRIKAILRDRFLERVSKKNPTFTSFSFEADIFANIRY